MCRAVAKQLDEREGPCGLVDRQGRIVLHSYVALNSPHLGSKRPSGLWGAVVNAVVGNTYGLTGRELLLADSHRSPLLVRMATEGHGYLESMRKFRTCTLVAALEDDHAVPVAAASIRWSAMYVHVTVYTYHVGRAHDVGRNSTVCKLHFAYTRSAS